MAINVPRIRSLKAEQTRLPQRQSDLAAQGGKIGKLAERLGLLERDDELLPAGFFGDETAIASNDLLLEQCSDAGLLFRFGKSERQRGVNAARNPDGARASRDG